MSLSSRQVEWNKFILKKKFKENVSPNKLMKNSLAFEIILDNPKIKTPAKLTPCNTPTKPLTSEDIKNKLNKAEERRQVFAHNNFNL